MTDFTQPMTADWELLSGIALPAKAGLYLFLQKQGIDFPSPLFELDKPSGRRSIVYIGMSKQNLATRIEAHLRNDSRVSSLRRSLGVLLKSQLDLTLHLHPLTNNYHFGEGETRLTEWMRKSLDVTFICTDDAFEAEKLLISILSPSLNISNNHQAAALEVKRRISAAKREAKSNGHPYLSLRMLLRSLTKPRENEELS